MTGRREREVGGSGDKMPGDGRLVLRDTPVSLCEGAVCKCRQSAVLTSGDTPGHLSMYMQADLHFKLP